MTTVTAVTATMRATVRYDHMLFHFILYKVMYGYGNKWIVTEMTKSLSCNIRDLLTAFQRNSGDIQAFQMNIRVRDGTVVRS